MSAFVPNQTNDSKRLLNSLLECVQECQKRFGGKTELATEFDPCVLLLCNTLEQVFLHGLRNRPLENISALKQVSDIVTNSLHLNNDTPSFWPFIKKQLTKHEEERYNVLKQIWTDTGRGKAWIRSTLNERSLERYFHTILRNKNLLKVYYEDWAFICDDEKNSLLPNMAAGLGSILFAVSIDKPEFNSCIYNRVEKHRPEPIIEAPLIVKKEVRKKRRVAKQVISFDEEENNLSSSTGSVTSDNYLNTMAAPKNLMLEPKMEEDESISSDSPSYESQEDPPKRKLSIENSGSRNRFPTKLEGTLTPLGISRDIGELTPVSTENCDVTGDVEAPCDVSAVLTAIENKNHDQVAKLQDKIDLLAQENENLKEQVKKYMGAVQMLKKDDEGLQRALNGLQVNEDPDYKSEAKLFEHKLVQVAEMHAELMDFNVVLQQNICQKDAMIERLKGELEELRGPINEEEDDSPSLVNVWIPSAFLTGTGSESHHVYQIFLRAGADEWNIYRRYAQFHALHSDLKKLDPAISSFDFPPKKSLRNKESSLVEDRRKRLQTYLRRILLHWPELSQCNSRFLLEQHLAFFKEQKDSKKRGLFSSKRTSATTSSENHYTGL